MLCVRRMIEFYDFSVFSVDAYIHHYAFCSLASYNCWCGVFYNRYSVEYILLIDIVFLVRF